MNAYEPYVNLATGIIESASRDIWKGWLKGGEECLEYRDARSFFLSPWYRFLLEYADCSRRNPCAPVVEYAVTEAGRDKERMKELERLLSEPWIHELGTFDPKAMMEALKKRRL